MQKPILALIILSIFFLPNSSQAGWKDVKARAKIAVKWPNHEQWKCRKLASYNTKDFFKARSIRFLGKHFAPSIVKDLIPKHHTIVFAELVGRGGKSGPTHYGPGYSTRYNIFIVTAEVPNTEYFWTRESRMNYGHGHGYIAFRGGAPLFVEAKRMITQIPYMADIGQTYNDVKDCTLWIRVLPLTSKLYEADPPTAKEKKVRAGSSRCLWLEQAKRAAGESNEQSQKRSNSEPITQTQTKHKSNSESITKTQAKHKEVPAIAVKPLPSFPRPGDVITNSIGMKLVYIPAGEFMMGSPSSESKRDDDEGPQHRVKLSKGFYMGQTEVTQAQYKAIMGSNPSYNKGDNLPVERVSWDKVNEFCKRLCRKEGWPYRLPTEAEWEYACRAGTQTPFYFGKELTKSNAKFVRIWLNKTSPVGSYTPNAFGLYDMHGNVLEWCSDRYDKNYYSKSPSVDPEGPNTGSNRVLRGGSCHSDPSDCRSANRIGVTPGWRTVFSGIRIVLGP